MPVISFAQSWSGFQAEFVFYYLNELKSGTVGAASPTQVTMSDFLSRVGPRMRALLRAMHVSRRKHEEGQHVVMTAGQMVEALFVVHAEVRGTQEFLLNGEKRSLPMELVQNGDPYRGTSNLRALVGGDAPGMRAVVRVF